MTIRVGQLVIHTERETQETRVYQQHSHKAKAAVETPPCEHAHPSSSCIVPHYFWGSTAGQRPWLPFSGWVLEGEPVVVQWWTWEVWTGRKEETCVFAHRNNIEIRKPTSYAPVYLSSVLDWKETPRCTVFKIVLTFLRKDLFTPQSFLDFEPNKHDRCRLIHHSKTCYSLLIISPLSIINIKSF